MSPFETEAISYFHDQLKLAKTGKGGSSLWSLSQTPKNMSHKEKRPNNAAHLGTFYC